MAARLPSGMLAARMARRTIFPGLSSVAFLAQTRTFSTNLRLEFPAKASAANAGSTEGVIKTKSRAASKATGKMRRATKKTKPVKKPAKKKVVKRREKPLTLPRGLRPPRRPSGPYILFTAEYYKTHPKPSSMEEAQMKVKEIGAEWKLMQEEEKQRYRETHSSLMKEYHEKLTEWFKTTDKKLVRLYNARRVARGARKVHLPPPPPEERRPLAAFIRYSQEFAMSDEAKQLSSQKARMTQAAERWRSMLQSEKEPYFEASKKDYAEYQQRKTKS